MLVDFEDEDLRKLFEEADFRLASIGPDLTTAYRKTVGLVSAALNERDLYAMRSLRFEKLKGKRAGQHSMRLNDQWRLIVRLEDRVEGRFVLVISIEDYH